MISEAIDVFDEYLKRKIKEQEESMKDLKEYGLSYRQSQILKDMIRNGEPVSQYELSVKYQDSSLYNQKGSVEIDGDWNG
jgi:uncharacterized protein YjaZ